MLLCSHFHSSLFDHNRKKNYSPENGVLGISDGYLNSLSDIYAESHLENNIES